MTLKEFEGRNANEQIQIIKDAGVHIGSREHPHHYIRLYRIESFYAEIFIHKKDDTIWKVGGFDHPILLKPYGDLTDVNSL